MKFLCNANDHEEMKALADEFISDKEARVKALTESKEFMEKMVKNLNDAQMEFWRKLEIMLFDKGFITKEEKDKANFTLESDTMQIIMTSRPGDGDHEDHPLLQALKNAAGAFGGFVVEDKSGGKNKKGVEKMFDAVEKKMNDDDDGTDLAPSGGFFEVVRKQQDKNKEKQD